MDVTIKTVSTCRNMESPKDSGKKKKRSKVQHRKDTDIYDLPLDLFLENFQYWNIYDIARFCKSSKRFRQLCSSDLVRLKLYEKNSFILYSKLVHLWNILLEYVLQGFRVIVKTCDGDQSITMYNSHRQDYFYQYFRFMVDVRGEKWIEKDLVCYSSEAYTHVARFQPSTDPNMYLNTFLEFHRVEDFLKRDVAQFYSIEIENYVDDKDYIVNGISHSIEELIVKNSFRSKVLASMFTVIKDRFDEKKLKISNVHDLLSDYSLKDISSIPIVNVTHDLTFQ